MNKKTDTNSAASTALSCSSERSLRNPCYCEENVWRLAYRKVHEQDINNHHNDGNNNNNNEEYHVVFISNEEKCCPMFQQLAAENEAKPCFWDYHVILICTMNNNKEGKMMPTVVLDMDSRAPFPCLLQDYLLSSFRKLEFIEEEYRHIYAPKFRYVYGQAEMRF
uniref:Protein N-terminal glutamine amidohydrolase n=1 Tax=Ditylum brightwellii TaxID=49249 RepID=A0A7S4VFW3_9STRA